MVCGFDYPLGLELPKDPYFVIDVWGEEIWTIDGTFGKHDHVHFSYRAMTGFRFRTIV
jgi:hypothetical protein